jgi:hypothetical protein
MLKFIDGLGILKWKRKREKGVRGRFYIVKVHFYGVWLKLSPWIILSIPVVILSCSDRAVDFNKNTFAKVHLPKNSPRASGQMTKEAGGLI